MDSSWIPHSTDDGSFTFFSEEFGETFHSLQGAREEAFAKFVATTDVAHKAQRGHIALLDVCYGLGYNSAAALEVIWRVNPTCEVTLYGLELDTSVPLAAIAPSLVQCWSPGVQEILQAIATQHTCTHSYVNATLLVGDARQTIQTLVNAGFKADAIFFDPFSPRRCPHLWTVEFFAQTLRCLAEDGRLATYSRSASVRAAMVEAGLCIGTLPLNREEHNSHEWAQGTVGAFSDRALIPLSPMEQEHLRTRAAIPYRDPFLCDSAAMILERHREEQERSARESTSSWRRRWGIR